MEGYCLHCKGKKELKDGKIIYYKNGAPAESGVCGGCGSKMLRVLSRIEREAIKERQKTGDQTNV